MARLRKEDAGERRTEHVGFYLTPSERAELDARAASTGYGFSDFCRIVLLSDYKAPAPTARPGGRDFARGQQYQPARPPCQRA